MADIGNTESGTAEAEREIVPGFSRFELGAALLESAADAIIASDREGRITFWNAGAERIFGFAAQEALGQSLDLIVPAPMRARHWAGYDTVISSGASRYGEGDLMTVPSLHKSGRRISLEFTLTLLKSEAGEVEGMVAVLRDVTTRFEEVKALRDARAELERKARQEV
ncbi:PAS domain-containing protein [Xanthobacter sp. TB0139]|uniref:PAS domain-containing protein n=1 Tax=Xanthobacter sp. TB0139 TaxID=3459178 RepID=UPI004039D8EB